jgi:excinuclease ABC subunit A
VLLRIDEVPELEKNKRHTIDIVIDRLIVKTDIRTRIFDAIELALDWSHGYVILLTDKEERLLSQHHSCKYCGFSVPKLEPRLFHLTLLLAMSNAKDLALIARRLLICSCE